MTGSDRGSDGAPPRVSVLLPAYQAESTLDVALRSVVRQSLPDWECVVVNDGSTDGTRALLDRWTKAEPRMRAAHVEHGGLVRALAHGLALCRGELVARMDADDLMHRRRLERQVRAFAATPELAAVGCHVRLFPRASLSDGRRAYEQWLNSLRDEDAVRRDRFVECPLAHPTLMLRREALDRHGYRALGWPEDYDLLLRLFASGDRVGVVPERLLCWRDTPGRLSRTDAAYALASFVRCKAHFLATGWLADRPRYVLWGYGDTGRSLCKELAALGRHPTHIVELHAGRIGQRIAGAEVIRPELLASLRPRPERIVVSVAGATARADIRSALAAFGFVEQRDYVCAA